MNFQEYLKENEAKYDGSEELYVNNSSIFDTRPYDKEKIKKALEKAGAKDIKFEELYGWGNQPEVVMFKGIDQKTAEDVVSKELFGDGQSSLTKVLVRNVALDRKNAPKE